MIDIDLRKFSLKPCQLLDIPQMTNFHFDSSDNAYSEVSSGFKAKLLMQLAERKRHSGTEAFTLVELMIVVAVIGILAAVALPRYLQARNSAAAGAAVGNVLGLAKECATFTASGVGVAPLSAGNATVTCGGQGATGTVQQTFTAGPVGIVCLGSTSTATNSKVTASIATTGALTCGFS